MTSLPKLNRTYVENTTCVSIAFAGSRQRSLLKTPLTRLVGRNMGHDRAECADEDSRKRCFAGSGQQQRKRHDRQHHNIIDDDAHKYDLPYFHTIISGRGKDLKITVPSLYAEYRKHRNQAHQNRDEIDSACDREPGDQLCPNGFPSAILGRKNDCVCACLIFISETGEMMMHTTSAISRNTVGKSRVNSVFHPSE